MAASHPLLFRGMRLHIMIGVEQFVPKPAGREPVPIGLDHQHTLRRTGGSTWRPFVCTGKGLGG